MKIKCELCGKTAEETGRLHWIHGNIAREIFRGKEYKKNLDHRKKNFLACKTCRMALKANNMTLVLQEYKGKTIEV